MQDCTTEHTNHQNLMDNTWCRFCKGTKRNVSRKSFNARYVQFSVSKLKKNYKKMENELFAVLSNVVFYISKELVKAYLSYQTKYWHKGLMDYVIP